MIDEQELRTSIEKELENIIKVQNNPTKDSYREIHRPSVIFELEKSKDWIARKFSDYEHFFANGYDIDPLKITPILVEVNENWQKDLFRIARLTWSLPYTKGYGRRLRYLIFDKSNEKLIGIFGLQSPPLDFPSRDRLFTYPPNRKVELINQTMDIYTLGAIPPYNKLLAGKLVALAVTANEVRVRYHQKYDGVLTELSEQSLPANLVCLTTTSAFGRSSIYNRLKYNGEQVAISIGYTEGYGSFHLSTIYPLIKKYLEEQGISTKGGFGVGPRITWQTYTRVQQKLGLPKDILKHGVKREVFIFPLIDNLKSYMEGNNSMPSFINHPFSALERWWNKRWLIPRASSVDGWHEWSNSGIKNMLIGEKENVEFKQ